LITECTIDIALWLADNTATIARHETAGDCYRDIKTIIDTIERVINRPIADRFLGPCPQLLSDNYGERICNTELTSGRDDRSVQCPACKTTHTVEQLHADQMERTNGMSFTLSQLYRMVLPINREYIPLRTLQHWVANGRLIPTGYEDDEPRFLLADVRRLQTQKPQTAATGAAAEKYRCK
jgi:hypothetical protein